MKVKAIKEKRTKMIFDGEHKSNSLLIGNFGEVEFLARGHFDLSGMIYSKSTVEFTVIGTGTVRFHGFCKRVVIHLVKGDCMLDFSKLSTKEVICFSQRDKSKIIIGPTKVITRANVQDEAIFQYWSSPIIRHYSVIGKAKIESLVPLLIF